MAPYIFLIIAFILNNYIQWNSLISNSSLAHKMAAIIREVANKGTELTQNLHLGPENCLLIEQYCIAKKAVANK